MMKGWFSKLPNYILPYPILFFLLSLAQGLITPVLVIFYRDRGISLLEIGLIVTAFEFSMVVFEVPTGYIADYFGRKRSVLCAFVCFVFSGLVYLVSKDLLSFILASIVQGIGFTCISGALQAWAVNTLKKNDHQSLVQLTFISATQSKKFGFIVGSLLGGYLGLKWISLVWLTYIFINIFAFVYSVLTMQEDVIQMDREKRSNYSKIGGIHDLLINDSRYIVKMVLLLFVACLISQFSLSPVDEYWTVFFSEDLSMQPHIFGWLIAISNILLIIFVRPIITFLSEKLNSLWSLVVIDICLIVVIIMLAVIYSPLLAMIALVGYRLCVGIYEPIEETYVNSLINDAYRATVLSVYNMAGAIGEVISGVCIGVVAQLFGLRTAFLLSSFFIFLILMIFKWIGSLYRTEMKLDSIEKSFS